MPTCQICKTTYAHIKFVTADITVCGRCVESINGYRQIAEISYQTFRERLKKGMLRKNTGRAEDASLPVWQRENAKEIIKNINRAVDRYLPNWITKLLSDPANRAEPYKILRAHRRGLLHRYTPVSLELPNGFDSIAKKIRKRDHFRCQICHSTGVELQVHHIIFRRNFGTNQKHNLITLCRSCHQDQHEHEFTSIESQIDSDSLNQNAESEATFDALVSLANAFQASVEVNSNECKTNPEAISDVPDPNRSPTKATVPTAITQTTVTNLTESPFDRKLQPHEIIICVALAFVLALVLFIATLR